MAVYISFERALRAESNDIKINEIWLMWTKLWPFILSTCIGTESQGKDEKRGANSKLCITKIHSKISNIKIFPSFSIFRDIDLNF